MVYNKYTGINGVI